MRISFSRFRRRFRRKKRSTIVLLALTLVTTLIYVLINQKGSESDELDKLEGKEEPTNLRLTELKSEAGEEIGKHWTSMAYFWSGDDLKDFFFKGFDVNAREGLAGVCIGLASSAIVFEGLRNCRDHYLKRFVDKRRSQRILNFKKKSSARVKRTRNSKSPIPGPANDVDIGGGGDMGDASAALMRSPEEDDDDYELNTRSGNNFSGASPGDACNKDQWKHFSYLFVSSLLHVVYISIGYMLMLAVMTFNVWILVAICIGVGIGQFIFGVFRRTEIFLVEEKDIRPSSRNNSDEAGISPSATATTELGVPDQSGDYNRTQPDLLDVRHDGRYSSPPSSDSDNGNQGRLTTEIIVHPPASSLAESPLP